MSSRWDDYAHRLASGRWIVATWSDRNSQWTSRDVTDSSCYAFAATLASMVRCCHVRTHKTREAALRRARVLYPEAGLAVESYGEQAMEVDHA